MNLTRPTQHRLLTAMALAMVCAASPGVGPWDRARCSAAPPIERQATSDDFHVLHAPPFVCQADFSLRPLAPLVSDLKRLAEDLATELRLRGADQPIHLRLFRDETDYRRYVERQFPDVPFRRALFVKRRGQGTIYAFLSDDLAIDLRHECTHALLHAALPHVPLWLDEGLAEYFEVPPGQRAFEHQHLSRIRWNVRLGRVPSLERLEVITDLGDMRDSQYRDAWAWVHFMLHGPAGAHDELIHYLSDIAAGRPAGQLSDRLTRVVADPRHRLADHFRGWSSGRPNDEGSRSVSNQPFRLQHRK